MNRCTGFNRRVTTFSRPCIKRRRPHSDDPFRIRRLNGRDHIARINGSLKRVGALDGNDILDLSDIEQSSHTWHDVLAVGGRGGQYIVVALTQLGD